MSLRKCADVSDMSRQPDVRDTKTEIVSLYPPHVAVVLDANLLLIVQKYEQVLFGVYGEINFTEILVLYSAIEECDSDVKVYTPCSSFIDWTEK
jgi:hypothetical protein